MRFLPPSPARRGGFTLLKVVIVLLVVSALCSLAAPLVRRAQREARSTAVVSDLQSFASAFQAHAHARGDWPPATRIGGVPAGLQTSPVAAHWERTTPIGGRYIWAPDTLQQGERYRAAILISGVGNNPVSDDRRQLTDIDRRMDDGDLWTGRFRLGYRNQPVLVIEH